MMLSSRFAVPVLVLFALAAVPTIIHSYIDTSYADGRSARTIPLELAGETGAATKRRANWGDDRFGSEDWIERRYTAGAEVKLVIARSFDPKRLYHHPELAVDYGERYQGATTIRLPQRTEIPVHVLSGQNGRHFAIYTLHYDDRYVADPIAFQLRTSLRSLFDRRRAMTLFFAGQDLPANGAIETSHAASVLLAAMAEFEAQPQKIK
jgi:hypothetical protein